MARVAAQYAYMVSSDFESPEARYALGPYTPVDPRSRETRRQSQWSECLETRLVAGSSLLW